MPPFGAGDDFSSMMELTRRDFLRCTAGALVFGEPVAALSGTHAPFRLRYVLSTSLYGTMGIEEILPQVKAARCEGLDIWAGRWGNQREQIDEMGHGRFRRLLASHGVGVSTYTCMDTGFIRSEPHMIAMKGFGGDMVVAGFPGGGAGAKDLRGDDLRRGIRASAERLKPIIARAGELGVKLAIENHLNGLLESPESLLILAEEIPDRHVGIAFAPFHLPQDAALQARLIGELGERMFYFYAWDYGDGSGDIPRVQQMKQMPGIGPMDFTPLLGALKRIRFDGWTSVFMHPTPRGSPILPTATEVTGTIIRSQNYLHACLERV